MKDIAVVTVYNDHDLVDKMIDSFIKSVGELSYQVLAFDNIDNRMFSSAAEGYNYALKCCDAKVIIFCHQDILFLKNSVRDIYDLCNRERSTLFGAAGVKNVGHGENIRIISTMSMVKEGWNYQTLQKGTTEEVFTLDECLIAANMDLFKYVKFDSETCFGWHLYAADLSMQCLTKGMKVKVYDADVVHLSGGTPDATFYECEKRLAQKYKKLFPKISYTCGWTYTDPLRFLLLRAYRKWRYHI